MNDVASVSETFRELREEEERRKIVSDEFSSAQEKKIVGSPSRSRLEWKNERKVSAGRNNDASSERDDD